MLPASPLLRNSRTASLRLSSSLSQCSSTHPRSRPILSPARCIASASPLSRFTSGVLKTSPNGTRMASTTTQSSNGATAKDNKENGGKITDWASAKDGVFRRQASQYRSWISREAGAQYPPESGRYHVYVSYACPWAHRVLIVRALKGLEKHIGVTAVHWHMGSQGWRFATADEAGSKDVPGDLVRPDPLHKDFTHLRQVYFSVDKDYAGRFTVPTLYDTKTQTIVSNESAEIIRMLYHEFDDLLEGEHKSLDLLPKDLEKEIDDANAWIYPSINNGVYRSGFATQQDAYEAAVTELFEALDRAEKHLSQSKGGFWCGDRLTEADVRLFTTIVRFDAVYVQHFKCNIRDIRSGYPHLHEWVRRLYWDYPAFKDTTNFTHIKRHYTRSHSQINPHAITPVGPVPDILPKDEEVPAVKAALGGKK